MVILGLSSLDTDSTASLMVDGKVVAGLAEERLSRVKMHEGFPHRSIERILQDNGMKPQDIDTVTYPFLPWNKEGEKIAGCFIKDIFFNMVKNRMHFFVRFFFS